MTWLDMVVVGTIAFSTLWGLLRGMLRELFSLVGWVGGLYVAWRFGHTLVAPHLKGILPAEWVAPVADFLLFFLVLASATVIALLLRGLLYSVGLGFTDRLIGGFFGLLRAAVVIAIMVFLGRSFHLAESPWWQASWLGQPRVQSMAQSLTAPAISYWESQKIGKTVSEDFSNRG